MKAVKPYTGLTLDEYASQVEARRDQNKTVESFLSTVDPDSIDAVVELAGTVMLPGDYDDGISTRVASSYQTLVERSIALREGLETVRGFEAESVREKENYVNSSIMPPVGLANGPLGANELYMITGFVSVLGGIVLGVVAAKSIISPWFLSTIPALWTLAGSYRFRHSEKGREMIWDHVKSRKLKRGYKKSVEALPETAASWYSALEDFVEATETFNGQSPRLRGEPRPDFDVRGAYATLRSVVETAREFVPEEGEGIRYWLDTPEWTGVAPALYLDMDADDAELVEQFRALEAGEKEVKA